MKSKLKTKKLLAALLLSSVSSVALADFSFYKYEDALRKGPKAEVSVADSCKDILAADSGSASGVYTLTSGLDVYCDMTSNGGGWTMVAAQFELDPVMNWNEGIQADYDPTLSAGAGFALNSVEIPEHAQVGLGKDFSATGFDYFELVYLTVAMNAQVTGLKTGTQYVIHRNSGYSYLGHNPDSSLNTSNATLFDTLTASKVGEFTPLWAFSPKSSFRSSRGFGYGVYTSSSDESYAWTVWVR